MTTPHAGWRSPLHAIRDRIRFTVNAARVREPAFTVIDALQRYAPDVQIEAAFASAVILARTLNLDPYEMISRARRQLPDLEAVESQALAISDYAKNELR